MFARCARLSLCLVASAVLLGVPVGHAQKRSDVDSLSLVIVLDASASVTEAMSTFIWDGQGDLDGVAVSGRKTPDSPMAFLRGTLRSAIVRALKANDRIAIMRAGNRDTAIALAPPGSVASQLEAALSLSESERYGSSPLWDAAYLAVSTLSGAPEPRAIVLMTDGMASGNSVDSSTLAGHAALNRVRISAVVESWQRPRSARGWRISDTTNSPWNFLRSPFGVKPSEELETLAALTQGDVVVDAGERRPGELLVEVIERTRHGVETGDVAP